GLTRHTQGDFSLLGAPASSTEIRKRIGYLPENHRFPPFLTGFQVMLHFGMMNGVPKSEAQRRIPQLLELVKMQNWANRKVKTYSKGMMQRLGLAQAMLHNPDILFLDEPTDGVDPIGRMEIREILLNQKNAGKTIFLNSHLLSEVEMVCDKVGIIHHGKLVQEGSISDLTGAGNEYIVTFEHLPDQAVSDGKRISETQLSMLIQSTEDLNRHIDTWRSNGLLIISIAKGKRSLESIFIQNIAETDKEGKI
ncbi:partial Linearmycin resistance ATP-binding protein LnrL, partial [Candidatus Brocadiaceae bacterium]